MLWIAGIVAIIYGSVGGPTNLVAPSWNTMLLGLALWGVAAVWAAMATRRTDDRRCAERNSAVCQQMLSHDEERHPFNKVRKAR